MRELKLDICALWPGVDQGPYDYSILVDEIKTGRFRFENYGVGVTCRSTGERAQIEDITPNPKRIDDLCELLARNQVGPAHLREAVSNWL